MKVRSIRDISYFEIVTALIAARILVAVAISYVKRLVKIPDEMNQITQGKTPLETSRISALDGG